MDIPQSTKECACADPPWSARRRSPRWPPGRWPCPAAAGSSHREAPGILGDPTADNTDLYAYTAQDAPGSLTVVANWIPFEDPSGGPYFGKLDPKARYYVKIDNTGDGREDVAYRWQFKQTFRNPKSFLYARADGRLGRRPDLNFVQTYDLYKETYRNGRHGERRIAQQRAGRARQRRAEDDAELRDGLRGRREAADRGGGKTFVGPADDPFFIDLAAAFDGDQHRQAGRPGVGLGNQGGGKDDVAGYNTHSFVLQVPESEVTRDGKAVSGASRRQRGRRRLGDHRAQARERLGEPRTREAPGAWSRSAASATR